MNLLHLETSPYLLQHKDNPVHWRAWNAAAFQEAKRQNKPVLLSVGYTACHWCHVMAHESFENDEIARLMNEGFIPVKVDREERPDIDLIYQQALALTGQSGGWPLTMFLTPDARPFWGGTYFPPFASYGRPGLADVLTSISQHWQDSPSKVGINAEQLTEALRALSHLGQEEEGQTPDQAFQDKAAVALCEAIDTEFGGFMGAPKFPQVSSLTYLWRAWRRRGAESYRQAVLKTLEGMARGGIHDHVGGGFARYAIDTRWLVPHFEKMLYDNAQILELIALVWPEEKAPYLKAAAEGIVAWMTDEMASKQGGFAASQDADSEGEEGRYYVWTAKEITELLGERAPAFLKDFSIHADGNWEEGRNILHRLNSAQIWDESHAVDLKRLLRHRKTRTPPEQDGKVLADWNGMAIAALARAGWVFDRADWVVAARDAYRFVLANMTKGNRLSHSWCAGKTGSVGMIEDYAHMARAALAIHEITSEMVFLDHALVFCESAIAHHWDEKAGGFFQTPKDATDLPLRAKPYHDNATPSGNGVMAETLARLYHLTGEQRWHDRAKATVLAFAGALPRQYQGMTGMLAASDHLDHAMVVSVHGELHAPDTDRLIAVLLDLSLPDRIFRFVEATGPAFATVCRNQVCSAPLSSADALRNELLSDYCGA
ncbi:MAG: thioredoxin domain-containing protein [Alphaproteobacteria bacterium]|nr:thioredoxin domain-containing protein [Alphaproteobacteria bacterium]